MQLFVRTPCCGTLTVDVVSTDTAGGIKRQVHAKVELAACFFPRTG
jgi:hypothetical protein